MVMTQPARFDYAFSAASQQDHVSMLTARILYHGKPSVHGTARAQLSFLSGKPPIGSVQQPHIEEWEC